MITILLFVVILAGGIFLIYKFGDEFNMEGSILSFVGIVIAVLGGFAFAIGGIYCISEAVTNEANYKSALSQRENLEWRLEQTYTDNDNNIGSTELYVEIKDFNAELMSERALRDSLWTNWFVGDYVERVEPIELK